MRARVGRGKLERHSRVMVRRTTGEAGEPAMTVSGGADLCYFWREEAVCVDNQGLSSSVTGESTDSSSGPTENSDRTSQKCEEYERRSHEGLVPVCQYSENVPGDT